MDIPSEGDVRHIANWPTTHKFADLQKMVVDNGWSGVSLGKDGTAAARGAWFKSVAYPLKPGLTRPNGYIDSIWIYNPPNRPAA